MIRSVRSKINIVISRLVQTLYNVIKETNGDVADVINTKKIRNIKLKTWACVTFSEKVGIVQRGGRDVFHVNNFLSKYMTKYLIIISVIVMYIFLKTS